jgi:hypothetical protein
MSKSYEALSDEMSYTTLKDVKAKDLLSEMKKNSEALGEMSAEEWIDGYLQSLNYCIANPPKPIDEDDDEEKEICSMGKEAWFPSIPTEAERQDAWDNLSRGEYESWLNKYNQVPK